MKDTLFASPASPYARTCRVAVIEMGLTDQVLIEMVNPMEDPPALRAVNPLGLIPCLVTDGEAVMDSLAIVYALDQRASGRFIPRQGADEVAERRLWALAQGVLDAAVRSVQEYRRDEAQRSDMWLVRWRWAVLDTLSHLEAAHDAWDGNSVAAWHLGVALDYLDFRLPDVLWKNHRPRLAAYQTQMQARDSFRATRPAG